MAGPPSLALQGGLSGLCSPESLQQGGWAPSRGSAGLHAEGLLEDPVVRVLVEPLLVSCRLTSRWPSPLS